MTSAKDSKPTSSRSTRQEGSTGAPSSSSRWTTATTPNAPARTQGSWIEQEAWLAADPVYCQRHIEPSPRFRSPKRAKVAFVGPFHRCRADAHVSSQRLQHSRKLTRDELEKIVDFYANDRNEEILHHPTTTTRSEKKILPPWNSR